MGDVQEENFHGPLEETFRMLNGNNDKDPEVWVVVVAVLGGDG